MQTVKFQCDKCQKMMAVGADLLGKQVKCPHCQQVILAPATAPAPAGAAAPALAPAGAPAVPGAAPEVVFRMPTPPRIEEEGSIFGENEEEGDDLFNAPRTPTVELPPAPLAPAPGGVATTPMAGLGAHPVTNGMTGEAHGEGASEMDSPAARARQLARMQSQRESKMTFMLLIVIVPYALIMTIAVIFLVLTRPDTSKNRDFPKLLPDPSQENRQIQKRAEDSRPLGDEVKVAFGAEQPIRVNQLEVTPVRLAWKKIYYGQENRSTEFEASQTPSLVLTLKIKNTSDKDAFAPNDLFFNRYYDNNSANKPYTCVEILDKGMEDRFYGGPTKWQARRGGGGAWREKDAREFIKGTEYNRVLKPGETMEMIVCTDPNNANINPAVTGATNLLWRVQLRCGFIEEDDNYGTVTTVIGVPFKPADIKNEG
jgi:hypothetical protein